jgi:DNA adenine methylase
MKYMGSKQRISKYILPIMLSEKRDNQVWVEPFVGGGNTIDKVSGERIGSDSNKYVIDALVSIRDFVHELPKDNSEFTEGDYKQLRASEEYKHKGYAGFAFSYGGKWLGGWSRDSDGKRDYVSEAYRNAVKQSKRLQGVKLLTCDYSQLDIPKNSIIYCDPPYANSTKYLNGFNHLDFFNWCRKKVIDGHIVYVSEYNAPDDFKCVFEKEIVSSLTKDTGSKKGVERLFKIDRIGGVQ